MPQITIPYKPRGHFKPLHDRSQRWAIAVAHRRAGKTVACINDLIRAAMTCPQHEPRFAYVAPYFSQAKDIAWGYLKHYTAPIPRVSVNESELRVDLPNGGRVRLYGADNYERLRGIYLDGVVLDEYGDMDPRAWQEVIRASLADRRGWAVFIGTPKGMNHFAEQWERGQRDDDWLTLKLKASETGLIPQSELDDARKEMSEDQYLAEFECSFEASVVGAYWGREMQAADTEGRISRVPYERDVAVDTAWDLGINDATAIWFTQTVGREVHVIDYYENAGEGLPHYAGVLQSRGYVYGRHVAPHDIRVRELGSGKSRLETAAALGIRFETAPDIGLIDGIDAARAFIPRCWFDRDKTERGRQAMVSYHKNWDEKRKTFLSQPYHDWCLSGDTEVLTKYGRYQIMNLPYIGEVLTPCGMLQYHSPRITRKSAPLVEVCFKDGLTVRCTPDHLFATENGWKYACDLMPNTAILSSLTLSRGILMAVSTAYGRANAIMRGAVRLFTGLCGSLPLALSLTGATSITETTTLATPAWSTSNASPRRNIYRFVGTGTVGNGILHPRHERRLRSGTVRKPVYFGIEGKQSVPKAGRNGNAVRALANSAIRCLMLWLGQTGLHRSFAPRFARPRIIERVKPLAETEDVWCITVPAVECFSLANGAIVHNSSNGADAWRYLAISHKITTGRSRDAEPRRQRQMEAGAGQSVAWLGA